MLIKKKAGPKTSVWNEKNIELLKKLFPKTDNATIAEKLSITVRAVRSKAFILRLKKDNRYWQYGQEKFLVKNWPVMSAEELAKELNKTRWAVINKYRELSGIRGKKEKHRDITPL